MLMTAETDIGINLGHQIMRLPRRTKQRDGHISRSCPGLVMNPASHPGSDMAGDASDIFMRRLHPTIVRGFDRVATRAKGWMVGKRDGDSAERQGSGG